MFEKKFGVFFNGAQCIYIQRIIYMYN